MTSGAYAKSFNSVNNHTLSTDSIPKAVKKRVAIGLDLWSRKVEVFFHEADEQRRWSVVGQLAGLKVESGEHSLK